jgi:hypothetical protein
VPSQAAGSCVFSEFQPVAGKIAAKVDGIKRSAAREATVCRWNAGFEVTGTRRVAQTRHINERDQPGSPDEPRTGVNFCAFLAFWQYRRVARTTALTSGSSNGFGKLSDLLRWEGDGA